MKLKSVFIQDGQVYQPGEEIPDLGSWKNTDPKSSSRIRNYEGLSKDFNKLPKYVGTGSSAVCLDTGDIYKFCEDTKEWYPFG